MDKFINIAISLLTIFVVAWINIGIKFAKSEHDAINFLRSSAIRILSATWYILSFLFIIYFLFKGGPINRVEIFTLILIFFGIAMQLSLRMDKNILQALANTHKDTLNLLEKLNIK